MAEPNKDTYAYLQDRLGTGEWGGIGISRDVIDIASGIKEPGDMTLGVPVYAVDANGVREDLGVKIKPKEQAAPEGIAAKPAWGGEPVTP